MKTFVEIGYTAGLRKKTLERYVLYMWIRWRGEEENMCRNGYAQEWADRFNSGIEYGSSDTEGKQILKGIDES